MITAGVLLIGSSLFLWICILGVRNTSLWNRLQYQICYQMLKQYAPLLASGSAVQSLYIEEDDTTMYDMQSESQLSYEQILAKKDPQETQAADASEEIKTFLWTRQIPEIRRQVKMVSVS